MAKRVTNIGVNVEYVDTNPKIRVTNLGINVEYVDTTNYFRVTNVGINVEYQETTVLHMIRANIAANNAFRSGGRQ